MREKGKGRRGIVLRVRARVSVAAARYMCSLAAVCLHSGTPHCHAVVIGASLALASANLALSEVLQTHVYCCYCCYYCYSSSCYYFSDDDDDDDS
jgi:hypothetical protein